MKKLPLSVCIIAKNEEKYIEECLKRIKPYGFEIIVTDTGSTDRTREIAREYADKVLDFEWIQDFSAARNFCASHASHDWILVLDCDEYVSSVNLDDMELFMNRVPTYQGMLRLKNLVYKEDGSGGYGTDDVARMYHRKYYVYDSPIHEQICAKDLKKRDEKVQTFLIPMEVIHHGYAIPTEEMDKKQRRNLEILYHSYQKGNTDAYTCFQIGQSEFILKNHETALTYYEKALSQNPPADYTYTQILIMCAARAYVELDRAQDALDLMNRYASEIKTAKYMFVHAGIYMDNQKPLQALMLYLKTVMMPDVDTLGENLLHCYEAIIDIYTDMEQPDMAAMFQEKYENCIKERERVLAN